MEFEIVAGRITEEEEGHNDQECGGRDDCGRPRKDWADLRNGAELSGVFLVWTIAGGQSCQIFFSKVN